MLSLPIKQKPNSAMTEYLAEKYGEKLATTTIEVKVDSASGSYALPDDEILRNKRIVGLFVPDTDGLSSPTGRSTVRYDAIDSAYLTLKQNNDEVLMEFPLSAMSHREGHRPVALFNLCSMNPSKSYIVVDPSEVNTGESFIITAIYVQ